MCVNMYVCMYVCTGNRQVGSKEPVDDGSDDVCCEHAGLWYESYYAVVVADLSFARDGRSRFR